jgi:hypothetical protein
MHKEFWLETLKGGYHVRNLSIDGRIMLKWTSGKQGGKLWTEFIWLKIGTGGSLL